MSRCFTEEWFYRALCKPDCIIRCSGTGVEVSATADITPEQRTRLNPDAESLNLSVCVEPPDFAPSVILSNVPETDSDAFDSEDRAAAFRALSRLVRERYGKGLVSYWHQRANRDVPGYRALNELETALVRQAIAKGEYGGWMFRSSREALRGLDDFISRVAADLDSMEIFDPDALDWLNCASNLKRKILLYGLPALSELNMFYGIERSREGFSILFYYFRFSYALSDALKTRTGMAPEPHMSGYSCAVFSSEMPRLSCAEYARRYGAPEDMARDWIRRGELRTAVWEKGDWSILAGTTPPGDKFLTQTYIRTEKQCPADAIAAYPFLSRLEPGQWFQIRETKPETYSVIRIPAGERNADGLTIAALRREEREQFEYDMLRADWVRYDRMPGMMRIDKLSSNEDER